MPRFDLMSLASIALLALAIYQAFRSWEQREMPLALGLLSLSALQVIWLLGLLAPWGALSAQTWIVVLAGMMACLAWGLLNMEPRGYTRSAAVLVLIIAAAQFLVGSGILGLPSL
ncbi:MAG: hypothetical protein GXY76_15355 [Chloroflexi bacterium]|nr:hypothetical protein [Chloroflexota bacterium]